MKRILLVLLLIVLAVQLTADRNDEYFNKGIAYILIDDASLAKKNLNQFFGNNPNPSLKNGFMLLIDGDHSEATHLFESYLGMNPRSQSALVGIALSTAEMTISNTMELLQRAIRLNPQFSSAYLCLGVEYKKLRNYPQAERNLIQALRLSNIPEYEIILGDLYLFLGDPNKAINMVKADAERYPDNFHFQYLLARSYFKLDNLREGRRYIEAAIDIKPRDSEANLLMAKYFLGLNELKKARLLLKDLKFEEYNQDYVKTFAHVLLKLRDNNVSNYLYEFFAQEKWDMDINRNMGLYYQWKKGKGNVQHWINRAILSGDKIEQLNQAFTDSYQFPQYDYLSLFEVNRLLWLSDEIFLAAGIQKSGENERIFIINAAPLKVLRTLNYQGKFQDIFFSPEGNNMIFSTANIENETVNFYAVTLAGTNFILKPIFGRSLPMPGGHVGFDSSGSLAYITDASISSLAFESPFSKVSLLGRKTPVYPVYPFPVYQYNFNTNRVVEITDPDQMKRVPIEAVQKYYLVCDAYQLNERVKDLIGLGQGFDITSTEVVKTYFASDLSAFIIYLSDLQNAFQAAIYTARDNKAVKIDETMFLGKGNYAELEILDFNPQEKEFIVLTKDKNKSLIRFNYNSFLFNRLSSDVRDFCRNQDQDAIYVLTEVSKTLYYSETNLEVISLDPFSKDIISSRKDLSKILFCKDSYPIYFSTYNGELLKMDEEYKFHYAGPSLEGCTYVVSPSNDKKAAFINGRIFVID